MVTGANSGIGKATARQLASAGAHVVLATRDRARGSGGPGPDPPGDRQRGVDLVVFDLSDLASVRPARPNPRSEPRVAGLVNNAGLVLSDRRRSADGFEMTFAVNHLGPFLLTALLLDRLVDLGSRPPWSPSSSNFPLG